MSGLCLNFREQFCKCCKIILRRETYLLSAAPKRMQGVWNRYQCAQPHQWENSNFCFLLWGLFLHAGGLQWWRCFIFPFLDFFFTLDASPFSCFFVFEHCLQIQWIMIFPEKNDRTSSAPPAGRRPLGGPTYLPVRMWGPVVFDLFCAWHHLHYTTQY